MILKNYWRKQIAAFSAFAVLSTTIFGGAAFGAEAFKQTTSKEESQREKDNKEISQFAATQGMVLLQNKNAVLPVAEGSKVALFGGGAIATVKGGGGSGDVNERAHDNVYEGLKEVYEITSEELMEDISASFEEAKKATRASDLEGNKYFTAAAGMFGGLGTIMAKDYALTDDDIAKADGDTGMYVISRYSTEGADWVKGAQGYYEISDTDIANLKLIAENYTNSVVILNVGGVINAKQLVDIEGLDAIFLMSQAGMLGGHALAQVLTGEVTPSGKTVDTWAEKYEDYPSAEGFSGNDGNVNVEDYDEGIFVGYRYFDTFGIDPVWEFGYGLSYTDFQITVTGMEADEEYTSVSVNVENTGKTFKGKEVIQVYFSAPEGSISKPYQELVAYAKTDELAPGEAQDLNICFKTSEMSSYSEKDAGYVMEKGDYVIRVGNSSRNTCVAGILTLDKDVITEQLSNLTFGKDNNNDVDDEIEKAKHDHITYEGEEAEIASAKECAIALDADKLKEVDGINDSPYTDKKITAYVTTETNASDDGTNRQTVEKVDTSKVKKLTDVYAQTSVEAREDAMHKLIAQMDPVELGTIIQGIGMGGFTGAVPEDKIGDTYVNTPGAAGESTFEYYDKYDIPNTVLSDGPAGIRITQEFQRTDGKTYYQFATAFPIGTLLAQTWDEEVINEVGKAVGEEMREFGVTLWLAPGMNIHRNPLCGRNFEYYSEDPFVTGTTGAAITRGVQSNPGLGVTVKHYTSNNQEDNRMEVDNHVSERAMREIYLKGFEMTVKNAQPMALMTCYNKINGTYGAGNYDTIMNALRGEWGFEGMVMTDWTAREQDILSMEAGNDMIQPGGAPGDIYKYLGVLDHPEFDDDGYVTSYDDMSWAAWGFIQHVENWGDFVLDKDGETVVSTEVVIEWTKEQLNTLGATPTDADLIKYGTLSMNKAVSENVAEGKAVVEVEDNTKYASDKETTFKVTYSGNYKEYAPANLGYSQRSVFNILKMVMGSNHYALVDDSLSAADKWVDYLTKKWGFKPDQQLVNYVVVSAEKPAPVEPKEPTEEEKRAAEEAKKKAEIEKAISQNEVTGRIVGATLEVADLPGATINFNSQIPSFGKSFKAKDWKKFLGEISISYNNVEYAAKKVKVTKAKGKDSTSFNASVQITDIEGSGADFKKVKKAIKKATKADKKNFDNNKIKIRINPLNIEYAVSNNQIDKPVVKGKADKLKVTFKFASTGKKFTVTNGKKDTFALQASVTYDATTKTVKFKSGDVVGELKDGNYESKIK